MEKEGLLTVDGSRRLRSLTWDDYGISKGRYKELQGFCLQYLEKKEKAKRLGDYAIAAISTDAVRGGPDSSGPTEAAMRYYSQSEKAIRDCRIIEEASMWASNMGGYAEAWRAILRNVTEGTGFDILLVQQDLPFSGADFYGMRRAFFHRLDFLQEESQHYN